MKVLSITTRGLWLLSGCLLALPAAAFDFGNMMNPGEWFNGNRDRDDYYGDYYGPPGGYGYPYPYEAAPGYGAPGYGVPAYSAPGYTPGYATPGYPYPAQGYGASGYPAPGYAPQGSVPAYQAPSYAAPQAPAPAAKSGGTSTDDAEIERLKQRVRELEAERAGQATPWQVTPPAAAGTTGFPPPDAPGEAQAVDRIQTWQAPMEPSPAPVSAAPAGQASAEIMQPAAQDPQAWQPSMLPPAQNYGTPATERSATPAVESKAGPQHVPGDAERNAWRYTPPVQDPGPTSFELGR